MCIAKGTPNHVQQSLKDFLESFHPHVGVLQMLPVFSRFLVCSRLHHFQFRCLARLSQNICKNHPNPFKKEHVTCPFSNKTICNTKTNKKHLQGFAAQPKSEAFFGCHETREPNVGRIVTHLQYSPDCTEICEVFFFSHTKIYPPKKMIQ